LFRSRKGNLTAACCFDFDAPSAPDSLQGLPATQRDSLDLSFAEIDFNCEGSKERGMRPLDFLEVRL